MTNTNGLTIAIVRHLKYDGFDVWRNNTVGIYDAQKKIYRANPHTRKGIPDIIGFRKCDGKFIGIEIKTGSDKLSSEQASFISDLQAAGGIGMVVKTIDDFLERKHELLPDNSEKKRFLETVYKALQNGRIEKDMPLSVWNKVLL